MSDGYRVDPDTLTAFAARLDETADEVRAAASSLEDPVGDLGPEGITEAVDHLVAEWARVLRGVGLDVVADGLRAAGDSYREADEWRHD
ncbi:WXG100 family type VII secretion target [Saccharothrix sp. BKS2]|uniref:WXG100 family type VII secretion target n=1 Tax=Saccharothrix sp. BKS2 TaxID=3064400 RepID=UPI0039EC3B04